MSTTAQLLFVVLVFATVFVLAFTIVVPTFGPDRQSRKRLKKRLQQIAQAYGEQRSASLIRAKYLHDLSPLERQLESLPGMEGLNQLIEQGGHAYPAYRVVLLSALLWVGATAVAFVIFRLGLVSLAIGPVAGAIPYVKLSMDRAKRLNKFEEQLPDALDVMTRAMRAGHPFVDAVKLVGEEMDDPVAKEFALTFADINYGSDTRVALMNLLDRIPSVSILVLVTSVLVQREVGGNLTEVLEKISSVVRGRFRFQRRVRTLSAEGRLSAWILALIPFVLFFLLHTSTPSYLPMLVNDPLGHKLIGGSLVLMIIGMYWIRRIIRIDA